MMGETNGDHADTEEEIEPCELPIDGILDLHTLIPRRSKISLPTISMNARKEIFVEVRIIHGKGKGVLRRIVHGALTRHPGVQSFRLAGGDSGSWAPRSSISPLSTPMTNKRGNR